MGVTGWLKRIALCLCAALLIVVLVGAAIALARQGGALKPLQASGLAWDIWFLGWTFGALWSRPAIARPRLRDDLLHWTPTVVGFALLAEGSAIRIDDPHAALWASPLWTLPPAASWACTGLVAAGLLFTVWARLSLGSLWSGSVSRKTDHIIIESGPYGLVRHPIYTGLILAAFAMAVQIHMPANLFGAGLMSVGLWLKARLEERFIAEQLGREAYAAYKARTPMLIPLLPPRH